MACPFCEIIERKAHAEILYESPLSIAFLDVNPINFGHALVVSKEHYADFLELPPSSLEDVTTTLRLVAQAVVDAFHPAGFNIFNNNGSAAGQSVFHFHFHVAPRYEQDGLKIKPHLKVYQSPEQMAEYADRIRGKINFKVKSGESK